MTCIQRKLVVVGDNALEKTSLLIAFTTGTFTEVSILFEE